MKDGSIHNEGPYSAKFDDSKWEEVRIPHDWVTTLPYEQKASHSHGYKTVGYKYPETSVGWYRKSIHIEKEDLGKQISLQFDGIFRNARVWFNGFYLGTEPSGYATQVYDVTEYVNYGGDNLICVRADATLEEGWFYEGAGIYRDVWLIKTGTVSVAPFGTFVHIDTEIHNSTLDRQSCQIEQRLLDADGKEVGKATAATLDLQGKQTSGCKQQLTFNNPHLWSTTDPYLYQVETTIKVNGLVTDVYTTTTGFREVAFDADKGFLLNGKPMELKGVNLHQDHAGVGAAIPDALQAWRIQQLKQFGCNAYRASHNPMTPALLDICDREGILVIDENRLTGINTEHLRLLENMIKRDRNHPSIILWSDGNEEWGIENTIQGTRIAAAMREYTRLLDPTGTEETTGCGTRGVYFNSPDQPGHMVAMNRDTTHHHVENVIERGWQFYADRPWAAGLFYWTGFDYRGEPNPLSYPAHDSEFGILDYCGFWKDEAWYLKSWWTDEPTLHLFPHWNLQGHEGEEIELWAYSNCDEVELIVNGKKLGRQAMPKNGHLKWKATYQPGKVVAIGYKNGKRILTETLETTKPADKIIMTSDKQTITADGLDVAVVNIELKDAKGRFVPDACPMLTFRLEGNGRIIGAGNGDPSYLGADHPKDKDCKEFRIPAFNGLAQVLIQSNRDAGNILLKCNSNGLKEGTTMIQSVQ